MLPLYVTEIQTTRNLCHSKDFRKTMTMGGTALYNANNEVVM
jgi:hypothetical protein